MAPGKGASRFCSARVGMGLRDYNKSAGANVHLYKVPLVLEPQPEGGYVVTSTLLPELITEGDTVDEAIARVRDALEAVIEIYEDLGRPLPTDLRLDPQSDAVRFEYLLSGA